jgi:hypothetical protein
MQTLLQLCLEALAAQIHRVRSLRGISEELAVELFDEVLRRAKLTPEVLALFVATEHDLLLGRIRVLNMRDTPPVLKTTSRGWLGDRSHLY